VPDALHDFVESPHLVQPGLVNGDLGGEFHFPEGLVLLYYEQGVSKGTIWTLLADWLCSRQDSEVVHGARLGGYSLFG